VHVTFVCEVNQARSPVAAVLFAAELARRDATSGATSGASSWTVDSAGVAGPPGEPAMPRMRELAAERGLDLSEHRSRTLDAASIDAADLLLTMTPAQADRVGLAGGGLAARCFVLGELVALLEAVAQVPLPATGPHDAPAAVGLPDGPAARVLAAHARRPFRLPDPDDAVADPLPGSGIHPDATFARLERLTASLAALLLDADPAGGADVRP
jgi:protein-tyrosine-phosphatase